jgi:hypothetical protein
MQDFEPHSFESQNFQRVLSCLMRGKGQIVESLTQAKLGQRQKDWPPIVADVVMCAASGQIRDLVMPPGPSDRGPLATVMSNRVVLPKCIVAVPYAFVHTLGEVQKELAAYKRFRELTQEWVTQELALSQLRLDLARRKDDEK